MSQQVEQLTELQVKQQKAMDGFANFVSKVGANAGGNNQLSESTYVFNLLSRNRILLEAMYRGSWVIGKIIDTVANDMTKAGIAITSSSEAGVELKLQAEISKLKIWDSFNSLTKWADLYGGSIGVFLLDGQDLSTPLDISRIKKSQFKGIKVLDRWQVTPDLVNLIQQGPDMGLPEYYTMVTSPLSLSQGAQIDKNEFGYANGTIIHHSRVIRQTGIDLPYFQAIVEQLWGESVLERVYDRLVSFDNATMSSANLINHANLTNVSIDGLREIVSAGGKAQEGLQAQFDMMRFMRSNEGITLVDKNDTVGTNSYTFSGLDSMLLQFGQQLSGASGIPLVKFFGQSPAGLSGSGEGDLRNYYDEINAKQEKKYRAGIHKLLRIMHVSLFGSEAPSDMQFTFTPLWQMSAKEKSEIAQINSNTILSTFTAGLINRSGALKELRQQSAITGIFTNITDQDIVEAEKDDQFEDPPLLTTENNPDISPSTDSYVSKVKDAFNKAYEKVMSKKV